MLAGQSTRKFIVWACLLNLPVVMLAGPTLGWVACVPDMNSSSNDEDMRDLCSCASKSRVWTLSCILSPFVDRICILGLP